MRTLVDLVNNLLRRSLANIVHDDVRASRSEQQRVTVGEVIRPCRALAVDICARFAESSACTGDDDGVAVE